MADETSSEELMKLKRWIVVAAICISMTAIAGAQQRRTTFTGTVLIYGTGLNTRTVTDTFTLTLDSTTSQADAQRLLGVLQSGGQDDLRRALNGSEVGRFAIGSRVGLPVEAAVVDRADGRLRIRAVLERWQGFGELWRGGRSLDYPFSYIEMYVDERSGKGEGTFIAAAKIRWRNNKGQNQVEIEDFGTFPGRLMGVKMRGRSLS
jgi:hypothetical protein